MRSFPFYRQHDAMQCGIACLRMICAFLGKNYSIDSLSKICFASKDGVSLLGISEAAGELGLKTTCGKMSIDQLAKVELPVILHWNQNHFVVLYKIKSRKGRKSVYYVADPGNGLMQYQEKDFVDRWITVRSKGEDKGVAMIIQPTPAFYQQESTQAAGKRTFAFLLGYFKQFKYYFGQIILGLIVGCVLQLIFPFLTQAIVDVGITHKDLSFIWLILLGQLTLIFSQTILDFIQRWILLHISMRINISLISDFFIKLLKLPMGFFDTKLMGDLIQRMGDHKRVEQFLTTQSLTVFFSFF